MCKKGYIYKYTYPNGKVYIGQTRTSVKKRHYEHMNAAKKDRKCLCEMAIAKYGEPQLEILETIEVEDNEKIKLISLLNEAEKKWITEYDSTNRTKGYNIQCGGEMITTEEYIMEEKFYEIVEKERWNDRAEYVRETLDSIINKNGNVGEEGEIIDFHLKSSDMSKEERQVWYGIKFIGWNGTEMTFNSFVKTCPITDYLGDIIDDAFGDYIEYNHQLIWHQIDRKSKKILKDWRKNRD